MVTRAAVAAILTGIGLLPHTSAPASTLVCAATPSITQSWVGGFDLQFTVANTGTAPFNAWTVTFDLAAGNTVYTTWNGHFSQTGRQVTASNYASPSSTLAPGTRVSSFGGVVEGSGGTAVTNVVCTAQNVPSE
jgi:hypothetical protein